ncbi:amidase family protein [Amycolatopsis sp. PS_44_ISF1]|uniref:amidase family protein n=1 Tax=Amycolatopsis sp. PS_44_ISF1 TaxID=2974917 RepID=UPI0028DE5926|nr:amidase family protein [Amycolatopsis sp. PS_44_ISF1]MDT8911455.1 amidase family protein [Amycolatopsis sp. PS_44_ISF1]
MVQTAAEIARGVRAGELDPVRVTNEALARIDAADGVVGAFRRVRRAEAPAEAAQVARRPDLGELPLAGVPIAVKDVLEVAGEYAGHGSAAGPRTPFTADGLIASRLRAAGAVIIGLTRVPELCIFPMSDDPSGIARNPWDPALTAGGSSGGSAAAVAAGLVPIAHGTDGLGSIRLPSAMCGLVGLKPGFGVVREPSPGWFGMSTHGPMATTVEDAALLVSVLAERPDLAEPTVPGPRRIAVSTQVPVVRAKLPSLLTAAVSRAAQLLASSGHTVVEATPQYSAGAMLGAVARWSAGPARQAEEFDFARLQPRTRTHVRLGRLSRHLVRDRTRTRWQTRTAEFFADHDVLVTPVLGALPPKADRWHTRSHRANTSAAAGVGLFTGWWNLAGYPALTVPITNDPAQGPPAGVQLIAAPGGEGLLLGLAAELESVNPWPRTTAG